MKLWNYPSRVWQWPLFALGVVLFWLLLPLWFVLAVFWFKNNTAFILPHIQAIFYNSWELK